MFAHIYSFVSLFTCKLLNATSAISHLHIHLTMDSMNFPTSKWNNEQQIQFLWLFSFNTERIIERKALNGNNNIYDDICFAPRSSNEKCFQHPIHSPELISAWHSETKIDRSIFFRARRTQIARKWVLRRPLAMCILSNRSSLVDFNANFLWWRFDSTLTWKLEQNCRR